MHRPPLAQLRWSPIPRAPQCATFNTQSPPTSQVRKSRFADPREAKASARRPLQGLASADVVLAHAPTQLA
eukprot:5269575-Alexandrium_andersonii.AAC.1